MGSHHDDGKTTMPSTNKQGFHKGFLLTEKKSKPTKKTPTKTSGFQSGFLLGNSAAKKKKTAAKKKEKTATANESLALKPSKGFSKGFLISKDRDAGKETSSSVSKQQREDVLETTTKGDADPERRTKKKLVVSQALLDLDDPAPTKAQTNSLLIFGKDNHQSDALSPGRKKEGSPLISVIGTETLTRETTQSPLISIVETDNTDPYLSRNEDIEKSNLNGGTTTTASTTDSSSNSRDNEPLLTELTTRRRRQSGEPMPRWDPIEETTLATTLTDTEQTFSLESKEKDPLDDIAKDEPSLFDFQQELDSLLWKKRSEDDMSVAKKWTPVQAGWAWEWILQGTGKSRANRGLFARSLLKHHCISVLNVLQPKTKEDRAITLQAIQLVQEYLKYESCLPIEAWILTILPVVLQLAEQPRRTVLAQESWRTASLILSSYCETICSYATKEGDGSFALVPKLMTDFDRLLQIQLGWKLSKKSSAKNQLMVSILEDWKGINRVCKNKNCDLEWCQQIVGLKIDAMQNWGGLRQTLCGEFTINFPTAKVAFDVYQSAGSDSEDPYEFQKRNILRGILSSAVSIQTFSSPHEDMVESSMRLLPKCSTPGTINLVLSLLNFLWSNSSGLPDDIFCNHRTSEGHTIIPNSIEILHNALKSSTGNQHDTDKVEPTSQAISILIARCIMAHNDSLDLLKVIISKLGINKCSILILMTLLSSNPVPSGSDNELAIQDINTDSHEAIVSYASDLLISNISFSTYLQQRIMATHGRIFATSYLQLHSIVPRLIKLLHRREKGDGKEVGDTRPPIGAILTSIMEREVRLSNTDVLVDQVVKSLEKAIETEDIDRIADRVCSTFGGRWRRSLLESPGVGKEDFGDMLLSVGEAMLASPSSLVRLAVFGSLVGGDLSKKSFAAGDSGDRILLAIQKITKFCMENLKQSEEETGVKGVFFRLSPLLMLRRIPPVYFQIAREEESRRGTCDLNKLLHTLSGDLAGRLDIKTESEPTSKEEKLESSSEERRLCADIAGRCLSFGEFSGNVEPSSTFTRICMPAFSAFLRGAKKDSLSLTSIRSARAALYATCIHIPYSSDNECYQNDAYRLTASFAFQAISVGTDEVDVELSEDLVQLQTGCIEFFAVCFQRTLEMQLGKLRLSTTQLVEDAGQTKTWASVSQTSGYLVSDSLQQICQSVVTALKSGKYDGASTDSSTMELLGPHIQRPNGLPITARTCLWNALIVVSQRCRDVDLLRFSRSILPWVTGWGSEAKPKDGVHHPLCDAAAMQVIFTLVTRSKSFDCFGSQEGQTKECIRQAHLWALKAVNTNSGSTNNHSNQVRRLAALKLILAIVTIDSIASEGSALPNCLGPGELGQTFTLIAGLSNLDPDPDVRGLASHIVGSLRTSG